MWVSRLSAGLQAKGLPIWFPVRAHAWVAGQVPCGGCKILEMIHSAAIFNTPTMCLAMCLNELSEHLNQRSSVFARYSSLASKLLLTISSLDCFYLKPDRERAAISISILLNLVSKQNSLIHPLGESTTWTHTELWEEESVPSKSNNRKAGRCGSSLRPWRMEIPPPTRCPLLRELRQQKTTAATPLWGLVEPRKVLSEGELDFKVTSPSKEQP